MSFSLFILSSHQTLILTQTFVTFFSQRSSREEDGHQGVQHRRGLLRQRPGAGRLRAGRGGRRLQGGHEHPEQRALRDGGRPLRHHERRDFQSCEYGGGALLLLWEVSLQGKSLHVKSAEAAATLIHLFIKKKNMYCTLSKSTALTGSQTEMILYF